MKLVRPSERSSSSLLYGSSIIDAVAGRDFSNSLSQDAPPRRFRMAMDNGENLNTVVDRKTPEFARARLDCSPGAQRNIPSCGLPHHQVLLHGQISPAGVGADVNVAPVGAFKVLESSVYAEMYGCAKGSDFASGKHAQCASQKCVRFVWHIVCFCMHKDPTPNGGAWRHEDLAFA